jgi:hypothetical protein
MPAAWVPEFVMCVFIRPGAYTVNGTFEEACAFLEGYYWQHQIGHHLKGYERTMTEWNGFKDWLVQEAGCARANLWNKFRALHATEQQAIDTMLTAANAYCEHINQFEASRPKPYTANNEFRAAVMDAVRQRAGEVR